MISVRRVLIAMSACCLAAGCASAPISLAARTDSIALQSTPDQQTLSRSADAMEAGYREAGLIRDAGAMDTAMNWMGRLTGHGGDDAPVDAVTYYLDAHEADLARDGLAGTVLADLRYACELAAAVDRSAADVVQTGGGVSRAALNRSLGDVETAMAQSRDALDLFDSLITRVGTGDDAGMLGELQAQRAELAVTATRLRDHADALAALRRQGSRQPVS